MNLISKILFKSSSFHYWRIFQSQCYSVSASHYLLPYFVTGLFNKFVAVSDCKIFLAVLFLFCLFLGYTIEVHSLRLFLEQFLLFVLRVDFLLFCFKLLRKLRPLCPFLIGLLLLPFGAALVLYLFFIITLGGSWDLGTLWYLSTIGKCHLFWCV